MTIKTITAAAGPLLVADDVKALLRLLPEETEQDVFIQSLIGSAVAYCETFTRRRFLTQTVRLTLDGFSCGWRNQMFLGVDPIQSVEQVRYRDAGGEMQTLDPSRYRLITSNTPNELLPSYGMTWPTVQDNEASVEIDLVVGYGNTAADVPLEIMQAVRLLVAHWFQNREPGEQATQNHQVSDLINGLLMPHILWV